jgi:arsenite methyltransferase
VMTAPDFAELICSQPWGAIDLRYDGWYQYAVCEKAAVELSGGMEDEQQDEQPADWSTV